MTQDKAHIGTQRRWLSPQQLTGIVSSLNTDDFTYQDQMLTAISDIVIAINSSYNNPNDLSYDVVQNILQVLNTNPVDFPYIKISKSVLAKKPLILQLLILMQDIVNKDQHPYSKSQKKIIWLAIAMHTAILLMHQNKKTHSHNILMQFKLAQFSQSVRRTWIWKSLPDVSSLDIGAHNLLSIFTDILQQYEAQSVTLNNKGNANLSKSKKDDATLKAKLGQMQKITAAYNNAHFLKVATTKPKNRKPSKDIKVKSINLKEQPLAYQPDNNPTPYYWDTPSDDIEKQVPAIDVRFLAAATEEHRGLTTSFEEIIDHYEQPYFSYKGLADPLIRQSAPLQTIDISLQQNYMSQRNLALNSNTRLLSLAGYQGLFTALSQDAKLSMLNNHKNSASILLMSMLTALPIKSLMTPGYIGHPSIFSIGTRRAYIKHYLGITKRSSVFSSDQYENEFDEIKIPLPLWLIESLLVIDMPTTDEVNAYLSILRVRIGLPYLSLNRVETALHVVLSRYTPQSNAHIADIICRTPAPHAPAIYYSSHNSETLITHYKSALSVLNEANDFDVSYVTAWHKYTVGSAFALTPIYVCEVVHKIKVWVDDSTSADIHFNRTSIFTWFVFCLLTGVRPNNDISKVADIDIATGWLLIDDKPNKAVQNQRLVPLCPTLLHYLNDYKSYLINYQLHHPLKYEISASIDEIRLGYEGALLRLLADNADTLKTINRGDAYRMTKEIIDANPYWTRHFVRTQLEKNGVKLVLINAIIGHEKARQQVLGRFSSSSKAEIKSVSDTFEKIASLLALNTADVHPLQRYTEVTNAH